MGAVKGWQRESSPERFEEFFRALAHELGLEVTAMRQRGIYERHGRHGLVSLAVDFARQFIAADWLLADGGRCESFFVVPASRPAHAGLRLHGLNGSVPDDPIFRRWTEWLPGGQAPVSRDTVPSFFQLASALASKGEAETLSRSLLEQVEALHSERGYLQQLLREQSDELRRTRAELREALAFAHPEKMAPAPVTRAWDDLEKLSEWCIEHEGDIVVLPRASNSAKKSLYEDPAMIYAGLELLAGPYREHRLGRLSKAEFDALLPSGMRLSGSVAESVAGEQGDAYFVSWGGRRRFLDDHLAKGGGRDERYCLRIYFFWDEDSERVIVGSMPQHLKNSLA